MWIDDEVLVRCTEPMVVKVFVPTHPMVVLGAANDPGREVDLATCAEGRIPVLRRYGGGGTVLLHSGCVVVSLGLWVRQVYQNRFYFERINGALIDALAKSWPELSGLSQRGLSDLVQDDRKVAGTSLFRSRNYLLYQASLLIEARPEMIGRHLRHPSREPDYRAGRSHRDFLVGLSQLATGIDPGVCAASLTLMLPHTLNERLDGELIPPQAEQFSGLLRRVDQQQMN